MSAFPQHLAGSRAGARSSVAGRGEDEDGGASGTGRTEETASLVLGSLLKNEGFGSVTFFPVGDSNPE